MVYRINARFASTENAQAAARRINERVPEIIEIRIAYLAENLDGVEANNIVYAQNASLLSPQMNSTPDLIAWQEGLLGMPAHERGDECRLSILTTHDFRSMTEEILFNEGGFGIKASVIFD